MIEPAGIRGSVRALIVASVLALAVALGACRDAEPEPELAEPTELSNIELGRVGGRIYNEPERAEEILAENGLTPETFEVRVRAITNDPAQSAEYTRGFEEVADRSELPAGDSVVFRDGPAAPDTSGGTPR